MRNLVENLGVEGKTLIDIGAADGKVMLAALALGAKSVYGVELAGSSLETKFDAMVRKLRDGFLRQDQKAALKCNTDIVKLKLGSISEILRHQFPSMHRVTPGRNVLVSAVWHGFNVEAKEALLTILSRSQHVKRFSLVGPVKKDYGKSEDVLAFVRKANPKCRIKSISNESATLSGGGEKYRALTFELF